MSRDYDQEFVVVPGDDIQFVLDNCQALNCKCRITFAPGIYHVPTLNMSDKTTLEGMADTVLKPADL